MQGIKFSQSQFIRQLTVSGLDRPSWCENGDDRRGSRREPVVIEGILHQAKLEPVTVTLLDFSREGCAFACAGNFREDEPFFIHIDGIEPLRATVMWKGDLRFGCRFDKPIYAAVAHHITATLSRQNNRRDFQKRVNVIKSSIAR